MGSIYVTVADAAVCINFKMKKPEKFHIPMWRVDISIFTGVGALFTTIRISTI